MLIHCLEVHIYHDNRVATLLNLCCYLCPVTLGAGGGFLSIHIDIPTAPRMAAMETSAKIIPCKKNANL